MARRSRFSSIHFGGADPAFDGDGVRSVKLAGLVAVARSADKAAFHRMGIAPLYPSYRCLPDLAIRSPIWPSSRRSLAPAMAAAGLRRIAHRGGIDCRCIDQDDGRGEDDGKNADRRHHDGDYCFPHVGALNPGFAVPAMHPPARRAPGESVRDQRACMPPAGRSAPLKPGCAGSADRRHGRIIATRAR